MIRDANKMFEHLNDTQGQITLKINLKEKGCEGLNLIHLAQDRV
jgi:hypothetical protein